MLGIYEIEIGSLRALLAGRLDNPHDFVFVVGNYYLVALESTFGWLDSYPELVASSTFEGDLLQLLRMYEFMDVHLVHDLGGKRAYDYEIWHVVDDGDLTLPAVDFVGDELPTYSLQDGGAHVLDFCYLPDQLYLMYFEDIDETEYYCDAEDFGAALERAVGCNGWSIRDCQFGYMGIEPAFLSLGIFDDEGLFVDCAAGVIEVYLTRD